MEEGIPQFAWEHEGFKWYAWSGRRQLVCDSAGPAIAAMKLLMRAVNSERQHELAPIIYVSQRGFSYDSVGFWQRTIRLAKYWGLPRLQQLGIPSK